MGATWAGFAAILMWALLALFTDLSGRVPPFQLSAMAFAVATLVGIVASGFRRSGAAENPVPLRVRLIGIAGLFGYHFFYFTALRNAPAVEASLIAYLWPLLIVVGSALMPGERLGAHHILGTLLGLGGTVLLVTRGAGFAFESRYAFGYGMAGLCALTWSTYSLLSRRFASVPTSAVTSYCAGSAILSFACHLMLETTVWPQDPTQWLAVAGLGLMPVGAAFYVWDYGVKHGHIQVLGAASYAAPLLSTLVLIAAGSAEATLAVMGACILITVGAVVAAKDLILSKRRQPDSEPGA